MRNLIRLSGMMLMLCLSALTAREPLDSPDCSPDNGLSVTIIYDNYQADERLDTDWGFAALVEYDSHKMLFDAGRKSDLYQKNMAILGIDPSEIPTLFISHEHGDHTAGIPWILECNPSVNCYLPSTYAAQLESRKELPVHAHGIGKPIHLYGPFYSTGDDFRAFHEQGLVVKTGQGGLLLTGCGHPGVVEMVKVAEEDLGIRIHTVIGGLHLLRTGDKQLGEICDALKKMGVRKICPTHCTGDHAIAYIKRSFSEGYIPGGTGREIIIQPD